MTASAQPQRRTRFIFITGGVVSSLGKGIAAASIGRLLVARGLTVGLQKFDPYINVDPGTMSPYQHGEVFVTERRRRDRPRPRPLRALHRLEDLARVERHGRRDLQQRDPPERRGDFLGGTVQVVPHLTDEIKSA